jgi:hypothetical protein
MLRLEGFVEIQVLQRQGKNIQYYTERPHSSLCDLTPEEYAKNGSARVKEAESL